MRLIIVAAALSLAACTPKQNISEFALRDVVMPNGVTVKAEGLRDPFDMAKGAMFRKAFPKDRALLYEYAQPGNYTFWMYQTEVPLDTIWMDRNRYVVEIVPNMPPCPSKSAKDCPHYGGNHKAVAVLQVAAGMAEAYGVRIGSRLTY